MMKPASCMWLLLLLLMPVTDTDFPRTEEFVFPVDPAPRMHHEFTATVEWTSSMITGECFARRLGWSEPYTTFRLGDTKSIITLDNDCLQFTCGVSASEHPLLDLNRPWSACVHGQGCFRTLPQEEVWYPLDYTCNCFVSSRQYEYNADENNGVVHGQLSVVSGFLCQKTGCYHHGKTVPAGTVTWSDACQQTMCVVSDDKSELVTRFKDHEGCAYNSQCVRVGDTIQGFSDNICANLTCRRNTSQSTPTFHFEITPNGCSINDECYAEGETVYSEGDHKLLVCQIDSETGRPNFTQNYTGCLFNGQYYAVGAMVSIESECRKCEKHLDTETGQSSLKLKYSGCYMDDQCYESGQVIEREGDCKSLTCHVDADNRNSNFSITYKGCYDLETGSCSYRHNDTVSIDECFNRTCNAIASAKWTTFYAGAGSGDETCRPSTKICEVPHLRAPGCFSGARCFPVKYLLEFNDCFEYVCLMRQGEPQWKVRALGCQGPTGCMKFGEEYVDPYTRNTYRCEYQLTGLGYAYPTFYRACVMPDGTNVAVGNSTFIHNAWYTCSRNDGQVIMTYVNRTVQPDNDTLSCGINEITGETMYPGYWYFMGVARCKMNSSCETTCEYFDQPCKTSNMSLYEAHYIGDKINLDDSECVCTQDPKVRNMPPTDGPDDITNLYLCGEKGVTDADCKNHEFDIDMKWGELMWIGSSELCGCHPLARKVVCSDYTDDVINPNTSFT